MKLALCFCLILSSLQSGVVPPAVTKEAFKFFPSTPQEIEKFREEALKDIDSSVKHYTSQKTIDYQTVVAGWEQMVNPFLWKLAALLFLPQVASDLHDKTETEVPYFYQKLQEISKDEKVLNIVLTYAEHALANPYSINPSERYILGQFIKSIEGERAAVLYSQIAKQEQLPFTYIKGEAANKILPQDKKIVILNWNTCCFDGGLSMLFGGALPWQDRIDRIAEVLQKSGADIVCLQEFFSSAAAKELYTRLKKNFAHFYTDIGPKVNGFDPKSFGISSGLFVASAYPLDSPAFHPYNADDTPTNRAYGFFTGEVLGMRLVTTHLQPGSEEADAKYRKAQVKAIVNGINTKIPAFLCGDLNIDRGGEEYKDLLVPHFVNHYVGAAWTCCELRDFWWKAKENVTKFQTMLDPEKIDYFLTWKDTKTQSIRTSLITVNDTLTPWDSLSDHQAMITIIQL